MSIRSSVVIHLVHDFLIRRRKNKKLGGHHLSGRKGKEWNYQEIHKSAVLFTLHNDFYYWPIQVTVSSLLGVTMGFQYQTLDFHYECVCTQIVPLLSVTFLKILGKTETTLYFNETKLWGEKITLINCPRYVNWVTLI